MCGGPGGADRGEGEMWYRGLDVVCVVGRVELIGGGGVYVGVRGRMGVDLDE